jgi:putative photosynthetic complex assembly protein 2
MTNPWLVSLSAIFLWWFSTGAILWRVRHADRIGHDAHLWSVLLGLPLLVGGFLGLHFTLGNDTVGGVYVAFLSALAIWGWIELAFLSGVITGPDRRPCPPGAAMPERFLRATGTILWHEIALVCAMLAIWAISDGVANTTGLWTFAVLFFARISAKLNLFLGVPRINTEFLPRPLSHLASHFRHARMNWLFPISVTALTFAAACWIERAVASPTDAASVGHILLSVLTLLALLEHWFMVVPLPDQKLWRWMLPDPIPANPAPLREATTIRPQGPDALPLGRN